MEETYDSITEGTFVGTDGKTYLGIFDNGVCVDVIGEVADIHQIYLENQDCIDAFNAQK